MEVINNRTSSNYLVSVIAAVALICLSFISWLSLWSGYYTGSGLLNHHAPLTSSTTTRRLSVISSPDNQDTGRGGDSYSSNGDEILVLAFYFPQYHEVEENNRFWGQGWTEWEHVRAADYNQFGRRVSNY